MKDGKAENLNEAIKVFKMVKNIGSLLTACVFCQTKEDANKVLTEYKKDCPKYAETNIGYILGYLDSKERDRLYGLFSACNHPIFGEDFGRGKDISAKDAFNVGKKMACKTKKRRRFGSRSRNKKGGEYGLRSKRYQ